MLIIILMGFGPVLRAQDCRLTGHYEAFIRMEKRPSDRGAYLLDRVVQTDTGHCFAALVNGSPRFLEYLMTHCTAPQDKDALLGQPDSAALQHAYIEALGRDTGFRAVMERLAAQALNQTRPRDTVTTQELLNIAVKFFSIPRINEKGHYTGQVCTGINGLESTEAKRRPFLEAFCFATILNHYRSDQYDLYGAFAASFKRLYQVHLGLDEEERRLRAQGAMYLLMYDHPELKQALQYEYRRQQDTLPFVWKDQ